eukprot:Gb_31188 [translate_table: standard]
MAIVKEKKKMVLLFHVQGRNNSTGALKIEGDANNSSVRALCKQGLLKDALYMLRLMNQCVESATYDSLLHGCINKKALSEGKLVHAHMTESGFTPDIFLGNAIVSMYTKCGSLVNARRVFDQMRDRDVASWTGMIAAYARYGHGKEALTLFYQMHRTGIQPNQFTFASILPACDNVAVLKEVHQDIIRSGFHFDVFVASALVDKYAKCGNVKNAYAVFDKMPQRNVVLWNAMIAGYAQNGYVDEALKLFEKMPEQNVISWNAMIAGYAQHGYVDEALKLFQRMNKRNSATWNALIAGYAQNGYVDEALKLFQKMPERSVVSWTAMLAGYAQNGHGEEALNFFQQMKMAGAKPNSKTFASVLPACAILADLERGQEIHKEIIRSGFQSHVFVGSALVDMYSKCGSIATARDVFDKMHERDVVSWNAMIAGYAQNGHVYEALKLFEKMPERNVISWNAMIAGYTQNGCVGEAMKLFQKMPKRNVASWNVMIAGYAQNGHLNEALDLFLKMPERNVVSWTAVIAGYVHNGDVGEGLKFFQKMPEQNVVSWNVIIAGYAQNGCGQEALKLFRQMQLAGVKPNSKTFTSLLPACANLASLEQGKEIHKEIIIRRFQSDVFVESALVDMYAKCGSIENAHNVFGQMRQRDVVSWNVMIAGYAMHGHGKEAIKLFEQMQHSGMNPDHVTLIVILSACCHAGLVDEGKRYFDFMRQYYHLTPAMEHYGCMVDLLGRAGHLDEAQDFISNMPIKPDATVWGCLLGACTIHNNIQLGEYVAERLFELEPKNVVPYVLLSNMYAAVGRWDDIEKVRKMMKERRVKKKPGCSWIEINKQAYAFLVGDR